MIMDLIVSRWILMRIIYWWIIVGLSTPMSNGAMFNITRVFNNGDVFNTLMDDSKCDPKNCAVYRAVSVRSSPCYCQCPLSKPAFLQHLKQCADSIDDCKMIEFNNHNQAQQNQKLRIPTVFIPLNGQIVNPNGAPDWQGAGIDVDDTGRIPCSVFTVGYLSKDGFTPAENAQTLFKLHTENENTYFQWIGSKQDQNHLSGKIVQVSLQCEPNSAPEFCAVFRIVGKDVPTQSQDSSLVNQNNSSSERSNQLGLIVGIVCGVLLAVTLISVAIFWTVCWRQQKERLARKIQLHVMYQQRLQQQNGGVFQHFGQAFNPMHEAAVRSAIEMLQSYGVNSVGGNFNPFVEPQCWTQNEQQNFDHTSTDGRPIQLPPPPPYPHVKKRLHFSPEFFDPELMARPPPVAEEFLFELRRMIDVAKGRIRNRRYVPSLDEISEEDGHGLSSRKQSNAASRRASAAANSAEVLNIAAQLNLNNQYDISAIREEADSPRSNGEDSHGESSDSAGSSPANDSGGDSSETSKCSNDSGFCGEGNKNKVAHWLSRLPPSIQICEDSSPMYDDANNNLQIKQSNLLSTRPQQVTQELSYKDLNFSQQPSPLVEIPNNTRSNQHRLSLDMTASRQLNSFDQQNSPVNILANHFLRSYSIPQTTPSLTEAGLWSKNHHPLNYPLPLVHHRPSGCETLPRSFLNSSNNVILPNEFRHQHLPYVFSLPRGKPHSRPPLAPTIFSLSSQIPIENNNNNNNLNNSNV